MNLEAKQISLRYGGAAKSALDDVNFRVGPGELIAIAGPNGSGKTTLLRALLGVVAPTSGSVMLDGRSIAEWTRRDIARTVGALPQREEPAFPMLVRDAVALGRWAHLGLFAALGATDHDAIRSAVERCDVGPLLDRGVDTLSGGEWQRVRMARTLAAQPRLLLLDEPTSALDVGHEMALFELLAELAAAGIGVVVVTHHLNVAARFAHRVVLMQHGRVVAHGPPAVAMSAESLSTLFDWPVVVHHLADGSPQFVPSRTDIVPAPQ